MLGRNTFFLQLVTILNLVLQDTTIMMFINEAAYYWTNHFLRMCNYLLGVD